MEEIRYLNETLWPGQWGHFAVVLSFVAALLSVVAYTRSEHRHGDPGWRLLGRLAFHIHGISTLAVIGLLFYIMLNRMYEYEYVWAHVSDDLSPAYMFSAFWEDQAGSFLLWAFWHIVLGWILIVKAGKWEAPVMATVGLVQVFIISMILGIYLVPGAEDFKLGVNPFALLRDTMDIPLFQNADYLAQIKGKGLNPLLQNYWMTIHPPTLFLGFASTVVPFAYAVAGMWRRNANEWLAPALPWALFSGAVLGTGILMGAAWAYEALSFGGYWAWDPVENMSLVPWLTLLAGIHTHLVARSTGHSIRTTVVFYGISFLLILFSTFLTRSGILQDSSVHAFTTMGLEWQLVAFILFFTLWFLWFFIPYFRRIDVRKDEEALTSREFWMFMGSLIFLFSALLITFTTSIPVYNKLADVAGWIFGRDLTGWHRSLPVEPVAHYNKYQFWIAVLLGLLSGGTQFLRYGRAVSGQSARRLTLRLAVLASVAGLLTFLTWQWLRYDGWAYQVLVFSAWFAIVANADYLVSFFKGHLRLGASTLAHFGFGLMIVGIVASGLKKQHISRNSFAMEGILPGDMVQKNVLLFKDAPLLIQGYRVTYTGDTLVGHIRTYEVSFERLDENGTVTEHFLVHPNIQFDREFKKQAASNPSTKRYYNRDIFTHIAGLPPEQSDVERAKEKEDSLRYLLRYLMPLREDSLERVHVRLLGAEPLATHPDYEAEPGDLPVSATLVVRDGDLRDTLHPMVVFREGLVYTFPARSDATEVKVRLSDRILAHLVGSGDSLSWEEFHLRQGESVTGLGYSFHLAGIRQDIQHPAYQKRKGDIGISAVVTVQHPEWPALTDTLKPVYLIRQNSPQSLPDYSPLLGIQLRFVHIDPQTGEFTLVVQGPKQPAGIPVEIAENYVREDYIVLEAIIFPGINFFWLGSVLMMIGLGLGMWNRMRPAQK